MDLYDVLPLLGVSATLLLAALIAEIFLRIDECFSYQPRLRLAIVSLLYLYSSLNTFDGAIGRAFEWLKRVLPNTGETINATFAAWLTLMLCVVVCIAVPVALYLLMRYVRAFRETKLLTRNAGGRCTQTA